MQTIEDINRLLKEANEGERLSYPTFEKEIEKLHSQGKEADILLKVSERAYKAYLAKRPGADPFEETLYLANTEAKAFGPYGGYSIFATSIADMRRIIANPDLAYSGEVGCERIERMPFEWGMILLSTIRPAQRKY